MNQLKEMRQSLSLCLLLCLFPGALLLAPSVGAVEVEVSLRGSPNSMVRQNDIAHDMGFDFVRRPEDIEPLVDRGALVPLRGNAFYVVNDGVSYPYARPEVRLFVERLSKQYFEGTGERLVVTSLTRPVSEQPRNSHDLSVHPAGIALDLRISRRHGSRAWLESVLLKLEGQGLLDITRERYPPHYHVALFPETYREYLEEMVGDEALAQALRFEEKTPARPMSAASLPPLQVVASASAPVDGMWTLFLFGVPVLLVVLSFASLVWQSFDFGRADDDAR